MSRRPNYRIFLPVVLAFSLLLLQGCVKKQPIKVGVVAELTGKQSELGINLRNGIQLAAEEINAAGGVDGHPIKLVIKDDLGTPEGASNAENAVIDEGVVAVIGHLTSNQTVEGFKVTQTRGVLLFSGTASSSFFNQKNDLFIRTEPSNEYFGQQFAKYIRKNQNVSKMAIIYDIDNDTYSAPLAEAFANTFTNLGGSITVQTSFSGSNTKDFASIITSLLISKPDGVFIIASPINTATIAQLIRLQGWEGQLFSAPWSQGQDLINYGGDAVEGLLSLNAFFINDSSPALQEFKEKYQERFAEEPVFTSVIGWELMTFLAEALEKTNGESVGLPEALISIKTFHGLVGDIHMDEYGDSSRALYILKIKNHQFESIYKIEPEE